MLTNDAMITAILSIKSAIYPLRRAPDAIKEINCQSERYWPRVPKQIINIRSEKHQVQHQLLRSEEINCISVAARSRTNSAQMQSARN